MHEQNSTHTHSRRALDVVSIQTMNRAVIYETSLLLWAKGEKLLSWTKGKALTAITAKGKALAAITAKGKALIVITAKKKKGGGASAWLQKTFMPG